MRRGLPAGVLLTATRPAHGTYVVARPPYVVIDLSCVTVLRRRRLLAVAIWEHVRDGRIKNTARAIDELVFFGEGRRWRATTRPGMIRIQNSVSAYASCGRQTERRSSAWMPRRSRRRTKSAASIPTTPPAASIARKTGRGSANASRLRRRPVIAADAELTVGIPARESPGARHPVADIVI